MRKVRWLKEVDLWTDVYLSKVIRAQQTISDITKFDEMAYRNLHPYYISPTAIHLTMLKTTVSDYSVTDNIKLQHAIIKMNELLYEYYEIENVSENIKIKTAVGSLGFLEILLPHVPVSAITVAFIIYTLIGKTKNSSGETNTGIMAIISKGNELINDQMNRKKIKAEIGQIEANMRKTNAETSKIYSEADTINIANEKEAILVQNINAYCEELRTAADNSGIKIAQKLENIE